MTKELIAQKLQVLFVTLDPERDSEEVLKVYLASFNDKFIGLTGSTEEIERVAQQYKIFRLKVEKVRVIPLIILQLYI